MKKVHKVMMSQDGTRATVEFTDGSSQYVTRQILTANSHQIETVLFVVALFGILIAGLFLMSSIPSQSEIFSIISQ